MRTRRRNSNLTALAALRLLGRWTRLARGHVPFASGCSCGTGFGGVLIADFEQQILDHLRGKFGAACAPLLPNRLEEVLRALASAQDASPERSARILAEIDRVVDSFEELHRART